MSFKNSILAGNTLTRAAIQSEGFDSGVTGWQISRDGDAEFNNVLIRGTFETGDPPDPRVVIEDNFGAPRMALYSGDPQETSPAILSNRSTVDTGNTSWCQLETSDDGLGKMVLLMESPNGTDNDFGVSIQNTSANRALFLTDTDVRVQVARDIDPTGSSVDHAFQVGQNNSTNIGIGSTIIQARTNGVTSALGLNVFGSNVQVSTPGGTGTMIFANDNATALGTLINPIMIGSASTSFNIVMSRQAIQARNNGVAATLFLNNLGGLVLIGSSTARNLQFQTNEIQAADNGVVATLELNPTGGTVTAGGAFSAGGNISGSNISGFAISGTSGSFTGDLTVGDDLTVTSEIFTAQARIGAQAGDNIVINGNQVYARNSATNNGDLFLNHASSGIVYIGQGGTGIVVTNTDDVTIGNDCDVGSALRTPNIVTTASGANLNMNLATGSVREVTSSRVFKENISDAVIDVSRVLSLVPRTFQRNDDRDGKENILPVTESSPFYVGFIAEEAEDLNLKHWLHYNGDVVRGFAYDLFVVAHQAVLRDFARRIGVLERERNG